MASYDKCSYFDGEGNPTVRVSYCVYADLLGFSSLVRQKATLQDSIRLCKEVHRLNQERRSDLDPLDSEAAKWREWRYAMFSDSLVIGHPLDADKTDGEPEFGTVLDNIGRYQLSMVLDGFFARGAFTLDELHVSDNFCFGKALVEAVELEKKAVFPRVVVSPSVLELVRRYMSYYSDPGRSPEAEDVLISDEGISFVNYLARVDYGNAGPDMSLLKQHHDRVAEQIVLHGDAPHILNKYLWLRDYHNFYCRTLAMWPEEFCPSYAELDELLIPGKPIAGFARLAEPRNWSAPLTKLRY